MGTASLRGSCQMTMPMMLSASGTLNVWKVCPVSNDLLLYMQSRGSTISG